MNDRQFESLSKRKALSIGFGGRLVTSENDLNLVIHSTKDLLLQETIIEDPFLQFSPLLFSSTNPELIAKQFQKTTVTYCKEDGTIPGSTQLLDQAIASLILCKGKLHGGRDSFDKVFSQVLTENCAKDETDVEHVEDEPVFIANHSNKEESLEEMEKILLQGDHELAVIHAIKNELWSQALILSHFVSASSYRRVVNEFTLKTMKPGTPMFILFQLTAGKGVEAIQDEDRLSTKDLCKYWKQILRLILINRGFPNESSVLCSLGDRIWAETNSVSAAHICYLAAGLGVLDPQERIMLVGGDHVISQVNRFVNPGSIIRTEAVLFAQSLVNNPAIQLKYRQACKEFQPFRLVFAMWLADQGQLENAKMWYESIKNHSQFSNNYDKMFQEQLDLFGARLEGKKIFVRKEEDDNLHELRTKTGGTPPPPSNGYYFSSQERTPSYKKHPSERLEVSHIDLNLQSPVKSVTTTRKKSLFPFGPRITNQEGLMTVTTTQTIVQETTTTTVAVAPIPNNNAGPPPRQQLIENPSQVAMPPLPNNNNNAKVAPPPAPKRDVNKNVGGGGSSRWGDLRSWLTQKIIGVPENAKIASMGQALTSYYDEDRKCWVHPGDDVSQGPNTAAQGPPIIMTTTTITTTASGPTTAAAAPTPSMKNPRRPAYAVPPT